MYKQQLLLAELQLCSGLQLRTELWLRAELQLRAELLVWLQLSELFLRLRLADLRRLLFTLVLRREATAGLVATASVAVMGITIMVGIITTNLVAGEFKKARPPRAVERV